MEVIKFTKETYDETINSGKTVLVDFFATWCGPCKMMSPVVDAYAEDHPEITVGKIDVDEVGEVAHSLGIMSIPTFIVFKNGEEAARHVGSMSRGALDKFVEEAVKQ